MWVTPSIREAASIIPHPRLDPSAPLPSSLRRLIVAGGGTLIDLAKGLRRDSAASWELIAVPTLWGSGAEVSPIIVRNRDGRKEITIDASAIPDYFADFPAAAASAPPHLAKAACGDAWAHALEAFASPLASDTLRQQAAVLINRMLLLPLSWHPDWMDASRQACLLQARSGVGLIHGIAHVLEPNLSSPAYSHARLCSLFLWPVMRFNASSSTKLASLAATHQLPLDAVLAHLQLFYDQVLYDATFESLRTLWPVILRDPCTRTNTVLVRPASLSTLEELRS
jgi:alcohol dehydrogenase class IV